MAEKRTFSEKSRVAFWRFLFVLFFSIVFCCTGKAGAKETEKSEAEIIDVIKAYRGGIVRVESVCWDGEDEIYRTKSFSGFVVSQDTAGIYVVTIHDGLSYTSEEKDSIRLEYELEDNDRISEKTEIVFQGDLRVQASVIGESEQRNLTVFRLDQSINFEDALCFPKEKISGKEKIFLLSYPETVDQESAQYHAENVQITSGTILGSYQSDEISFLKHDIQADTASVGGPLLTEDGLVAGLLLTAKGKSDGTAISSESLKAFLNTFNISYQEREEVEEKQKLPVLNLLLGLVIIGLLAAVILQYIRGREARNAEKNADISGKKKNAILEYPSEKRMMPIEKNVFVIGRSQKADFILSESKGISRQHACICFENGGFYLSDLKSTNHTFLNGSRLGSDEKRMLKSGDEIMVGKERLIFHRK
jgi:hypothetical protein